MWLCSHSLWWREENYIGDVEQEVAEEIDQSLDDGLPGNWQDTGKVEYQPTERRLTYLLLSL